MTRRTHISAESAIATMAGVLALSTDFAVAQKSAVPSKPDERTIAHVLNRIGFGPRPGDIARVQQVGLTVYIEQQLHPERIATARLFAARLSEFPTLGMSTSQLAEEYFIQPTQFVARTSSNRPRRAEQRSVDGDDSPAATAADAAGTADACSRRLRRPERPHAGEGHPRDVVERQLEEVLTDFWFNHFNVFVGKGRCGSTHEYERDAIRANVLGNFRTMLGATAHSPAMLFYLSTTSRAGRPTRLRAARQQPLNPQRINSAPERAATAARAAPAADGEQQKRPQGGLNETTPRADGAAHARRRWRLHAGRRHRGGQDPHGWTIDRPQQGGGFIFREQMHESGSKTVMEKKFKEEGEKEGEKLLDMLAMHPSTAKHISFKLVQRFVADEPQPRSLTARQRSSSRRKAICAK